MLGKKIPKPHKKLFPPFPYIHIFVHCTFSQRNGKNLFLLFLRPWINLKADCGAAVGLACFVGCLQTNPSWLSVALSCYSCMVSGERYFPTKQNWLKSNMWQYFTVIINKQSTKGPFRLRDKHVIRDAWHLDNFFNITSSLGFLKISHPNSSVEPPSWFCIEMF